MKHNDTQSHQEDYLLADKSTFQKFFLRRNLAVFRYIYGLHGGPKEEVEDLTMKTFTRAWRSRKRFTGSEKAAFGWILKIARNLVIDSYRREENRRGNTDIETQILPSPGKTPEELVDQEEQIHILWRMLGKLSEQEQEMIVLRYMLDWRIKDIGKHLEIKENTVSVNIRRIFQKIRNNWPENG
jgi:RNA polymerase sigma-70 factor (ECF subfamily)